jgi:hypothetical protein
LFFPPSAFAGAAAALDETSSALQFYYLFDLLSGYRRAQAAELMPRVKF